MRITQSRILSHQICKIQPRILVRVCLKYGSRIEKISCNNRWLCVILMKNELQLLDNFEDVLLIAKLIFMTCFMYSNLEKISKNNIKFFKITKINLSAVQSLKFSVNYLKIGMCCIMPNSDKFFYDLFYVLNFKLFFKISKNQCYFLNVYEK